MGDVGVVGQRAIGLALKENSLASEEVAGRLE